MHFTEKKTKNHRLTEHPSAVARRQNEFMHPPRFMNYLVTSIPSRGIAHFLMESPSVAR
jgi:hypothetical protein